MVEVLLREIVVDLKLDIIEQLVADTCPDMQRRVVVVRDIDLDKFRSRCQPITLRIGFAVELVNAFRLLFYLRIF